MNNTTLIAIGELLVEFVSHQKGCELSMLGAYSGPYPSGAPAIFVDQAARCGANAMMIGSLGNDGFGRILKRRLIDDGVRTSAIQTADNLTTGVAFVSYNDDGSRNFIFHLSDTAADAVNFDPLYLPEGDLILHVSGSSLGNARLRRQIMLAVDAVLARGGRISCDPNARLELMKNSEARESLLELISKSSILLPSSADLEFLYPDFTEKEALDQMLGGPAEFVVLKRGSDGVTVLTENETFDLPPYDVSEVDPTGAGDCFCGTFVAQIIGGAPIKTAAELANAAGALSVTRRGPMEGNSGLDEIQQFIDSHGLLNPRSIRGNP